MRRQTFPKSSGFLTLSLAVVVKIMVREKLCKRKVLPLDQQGPHHFDVSAHLQTGIGRIIGLALPRPSPIRPLAGQGGFSHGAFCVTANETRERSCDAR
jgi:hypothetical protein